MKHLHKSTAAFLLLLPLGMPSFAAEPQKAAEPAQAPQKAPEPPKNMPMHQGMGMMGGAMTEEQKDQHMRAMQEHMLAMHDLSNQILAEKDPAKKEQLKNQQLQLMKAHHSQMMMKHQPMK